MRRRRTKVVVVEDQTIFRDVLVEWLGANPRLEVVGAHATAKEALAALGRAAVDVLLLDIGLPDEDGLALLAKLDPDNPRFVVLITAHEEPWVLKAALASRAHAIVMKGAPLADLGVAIERVVTGESFYCRRTAELLRRVGTRPSPVDALTAREREILVLVARGDTSKRIAKKLGITEKTVQNHRANLMDKLDIRDVASLTRLAVAHGLVSSSDVPLGTKA
jgi:two-component system nitrate/nitrite response regulator NarL